MNFTGTGMSDEICAVRIHQHLNGGYYATFGHGITNVFPTPRAAGIEGNRCAQNLYGSTVRLIDVNQLRG
jgi:hypothetical protein